MVIQDLAADLTEWDIIRSHSLLNPWESEVALYLFEVKRCHLTVWVFENLAQGLLNWCVSPNAPT